MKPSAVLASGALTNMTSKNPHPLRVGDRAVAVSRSWGIVSSHWLPSPGLRAAKPSSSGHKPRILGMDLGVFPWLGTLHNPKWLDLVGKPADFWGTTIGNTHFTVFWGDQMDQPTDMAPPPSCLNIQVVQVIHVQYFKSPWDTAVVCYVVFSPCPHHMSLG